MKRIPIKFEHISASIALLAFAGTLVYLPIATQRAAHKAALAVSAQSAKAIQPELAQINTTLGKVGRTADAMTAFLNQSTATMKTIQAQAQQIGADSHNEAKQLSQMTGAATELTQNAMKTIQTANTTIQGLEPVESSAAAELTSLRTATDSLNRQVSNPAIGETLANLAETSRNASLVSGDFERKFHAVLYPPPCKGHFCWMLKGWRYAKAAGEMAQPTYFGIEIFKAMKGNP